MGAQSLFVALLLIYIFIIFLITYTSYTLILIRTGLQKGVGLMGGYLLTYK